MSTINIKLIAISGDPIPNKTDKMEITVKERNKTW